MDIFSPEVRALAKEYGLTDEQLLAQLEGLKQKQRAIAALEGVTFDEAGDLLLRWQRLQLEQLKNQALEWNL